MMSACSTLHVRFFGIVTEHVAKERRCILGKLLRGSSCYGRKGLWDMARQSKSPQDGQEAERRNATTGFHFPQLCSVWAPSRQHGAIHLPRSVLCSQLSVKMSLNTWLVYLHLLMILDLMKLTEKINSCSGGWGAEQSN